MSVASRQWVRGMLGAMAAFTALALALRPASAQARIEEGHPELYENGKKVGERSAAALQVFFGQIDLESTELGSEGIECVTLGFGSGWNEGSPSRAVGQLLGWDAGGHVPEGADSKLSASCRQETKGKPVSFITDEAFVTSEENGAKEVEPGLRTLSIPWNVEFDCGVSHEEFVGLAKIGVPSTEFPRPVSSAKCPESLETGQVEDEQAYEKEREEKKGCYVSNPAPEGCLRLTVVEPAAGLEVAFGGTLRAEVENGVNNGLFATRWVFSFEGVGSSGALQCEFPSGCAATGIFVRNFKDVGSHVGLIQVK